MQRRGAGPFWSSAGRNNRGRDTYRDAMAMRVVFALVQQVMAMEHRNSPVTLLLAAVNVLFFLKPEGISAIVPSIRQGCLLPSKMIYAGQWSRLFWAPFLHGDEMHLYYNMGSLLWKGSRLEPQLGPIKFAALVAELLFTSGALYVAAATTMAAKSRFWTRGAFNSCAVGFSGVLFGLKIILNSRSAGWSTVAGFRLPTKYAAWAELVAIQLISPEASFLGHLCGIVAGLLHVYVFSKLFAVVERMWRRSARRNQRSNRGTSRTYGQGTWGS